MGASPPTLWMPGGVRTEIHLRGRDTGGAFCLLVDHPPAGWVLPRHRHRGVAETIHVVEGEFEMAVDDATIRLTRGQTVHVPPGVLHCGGNVGKTDGRRVVIFTPAGMENFFLEAGAATAEQEIDSRAVAASALRHGWEFAGNHG